MRYIAVLLILGLIVWASNFAYRLWLRPVDQPTQAMKELEARFNSHGIPGHLYAVRHGFSHAEVTATAAYEIKGYPLPVSLTEYATKQHAIDQSAASPQLPDPLQPIRMGKLVLTFNAWGDDTFAMAGNIRRASGGDGVEP
jgi:hypothetical protein